jgi:hypothetical protein
MSFVGDEVSVLTLVFKEFFNLNALLNEDVKQKEDESVFCRGWLLLHNVVQNMVS